MSSHPSGFSLKAFIYNGLEKYFYKNQNLGLTLMYVYIIPKKSPILVIKTKKK